MRIFIGENSIRFNSTGSSIGVQRERERGANSYLANSGWYREEMDREKSIAPTLLHTELLFVVSSYRGSINAGPRIDPPRFRFRRLFVRSLRLPSTPSPPEWIHRVGPIPLIGPLSRIDPLDSRFDALPPNSRTYCRWFMKIYVAYEWAGDEKDWARHFDDCALNGDKARFQILRCVQWLYIQRCLSFFFFRKSKCVFRATSPKRRWI